MSVGQPKQLGRLTDVCLYVLFKFLPENLAGNDNCRKFAALII